jgi:hypothetical protein
VGIEVEVEVDDDIGVADRFMVGDGKGSVGRPKG